MSGHNVLCGAPHRKPANSVPAETGGAVSALTPREHTVLSVNTHTILAKGIACATADNRQRKGTSAGKCSLTTGDDKYERSDITILILKLIVAAARNCLMLF